MKILFLLALAASLALATTTTCPPNFTTDGIELTPGCPGIIGDNFQIVVDPGHGVIAGNDNTLAEGLLNNNFLGDGDVNDIWIDYSITKTTDVTMDLITFTYEGSLSARTNTILVDGVPVSAAIPTGSVTALVGSDVALELITTGGIYNNFVVGFNDQDLNPNYANVFWGNETFNTKLIGPGPGSETAETTTLVMIGSGLVAVGLFRRRGDAE